MSLDAKANNRHPQFSNGTRQGSRKLVREGRVKRPRHKIENDAEKIRDPSRERKVQTGDTHIIVVRTALIRSRESISGKWEKMKRKNSTENQEQGRSED